MLVLSEDCAPESLHFCAQRLEDNAAHLDFSTAVLRTAFGFWTAGRLALGPRMLKEMCELQLFCGCERLGHALETLILQLLHDKGALELRTLLQS